MFIFFFAQLVLSCQTYHSKKSQKLILSERQVIFQKGLALFENSKYQESTIFFLKVSQFSESPQDEIYNEALWKLSFIYEKNGDFEKSILALLELEKRNSSNIPLFHIQFSLAKNYMRLENTALAFRILSEIDSRNPVKLYSAKEIFASLGTISSFNYDHLSIEELQFLGKIQKYFISVMESSDPAVNEKATILLKSIYENFLKILTKDSLNYEFKRSTCIEILEQLRKFDLYILNSLNFNSNTVHKFSLFSAEKQKFLTDWLHQ